MIIINLKKNIAIWVISPFPPTQSGGATGTYNLVKNLLKMNLNLELFTYKKFSNSNKNLKTHFAGVKSDSSFISGLVFIMIIVIKALVLYIKSNEKVDVIYCKNSRSPSWAGLIISKITKTPYVIHTSGPEINDPKSLANRSGIFLSSINPLLEKITLLALKNSSKIIANCKRDMNKLINMGIDPNKIVLIYNGVDTSLFRPISTEKKIKLRNYHKVGVDESVILNVSRPAREKGLPRLISTFYGINKSYPKITLIIIGVSYSYIYNILEQLKIKDIEDRIKCYPSINRMNEFYSISDIYICSSYSEGLSNAMLEAMSSGLPIFTTDVGDHSIVLKNCSCGNVISSDSTYGEFFKSFKIFFNSSNFIDKSKNSRKYVIENHSWRFFTKKILEILIEESKPQTLSKVTKYSIRSIEDAKY